MALSKFRYSIIVLLFVSLVPLFIIFDDGAARTMPLGWHLLQRPHMELVSILFREQSQWLRVFCILCYLVGFMYIRVTPALNQTDPHPSTAAKRTFPLMLWLGIFLIFYLVIYGLDSRATSYVCFIFALTVGVAVSIVPRNMFAATYNGFTLTLMCLIAASGVSAMFMHTGYNYHGQPRMSGIWDNPNTFGAFMSLGMVIMSSHVLNPGAAWIFPCCPAFWHALTRSVTLLLSGLFAVLLVRSMSRAAWLGSIVGIVYLLRVKWCFQVREWRRYKAALARKAMILYCVLIIPSVAVVSYHVGMLPTLRTPLVDRIMSILNTNDFSWRNRVSAWQGTLQMMADRPWFGFGWSHLESIYEGYYRSIKVPSEGTAVQLNDYFIIGSGLGLPALFCLGMYIILSLTTLPPNDEINGLKTVCRSGAIVLLVIFWFDGGLFRLSTAATFWILLELGRVD